MIRADQLCQIEIPVRTLEISLRFYQEVLGWRATPAEFYQYAVLEVPDQCPYGIALRQRDDLSASGAVGPLIYFRVEDPYELVKRIQRHGGQIIEGPNKVPGIGQSWVFSDPDGNQFGIVESRIR